jgi:hypothetical protein
MTARVILFVAWQLTFSFLGDSTMAPMGNLFEKASSFDYQLMARPGNNLGNPTLIFSVPLADFFRLSIVANDPTQGEVAQRKLKEDHAFALGQFMLKGLVNAARAEAGEVSPEVAEAFEHIAHMLNPQPYTAMQPVVVSLRSAGADGANLRWEKFPESGPMLAAKVYLGQKDLMYVVDGQHRRMGVEMLLNFLEEVRRSGQYPKAKSSLYPHESTVRDVPLEERVVWEGVYTVARSTCTIAVEAHLGLTVEQERQLFHDLNNKGRAVEKSLALEFDMANPVNQFIKSELIEKGVVRLARGEKVDWDDADTGVMTRKELVAVNAHLILNKSNINSATAGEVDERREVSLQFWEAVRQCDGFGDADARKRTVLAQPVMLKALAKLTFDFAFGRAKQRSEENLALLLDGMTDIDFSHDNPIWRYFEMSEAERIKNNLAGLAEYVPEEGTGNRDIGAFDKAAGVMRFGAKHNDIFPILGDMVRFQLGLPSRRKDVAVE